MQRSNVTSHVDAQHTDKAREDRIRRALAHQGFRLAKSRIRNPKLPGYGGYMVINAATNYIEAGAAVNGFDMSLDEVEAFTHFD
jgi:G:T-mismatch repair DNA endonuclease (very short patch repair protein)